MGMIRIKFKNLCAFFTKKLAVEKQLMVGLMDLSDFYDVPEKDWHMPKITIETNKKVTNPNGEEVLVNNAFSYERFPGRNCGHLHGDLTRLISGDIRLDVIGGVAGVELDESADSILDIEDTLHPNASLAPNPLLCKARFHFRNGTLSGAELDDVNFAASDDPETPVLEDLVVAIEGGLQVLVPETGYAVLRFLNSDAANFVFAGESDYEVTIENSPLPQESHLGIEQKKEHESHPNHFQYYYKLLTQPPAQQLEPMEEDETPELGGPFCMISKFSKANYPSVFPVS